MIRSGNPALQVFEKPQLWGDSGSSYGTTMTAARATGMTINGTIVKSAILLALCASSGAVTWSLLGENQNAMFAGLGGGLLAMVLGLVMGFSPKTSPFLAPIFAIAEGAFVAAISAFIGMRYLGKMDPGLVLQGVGATMGVFGGLLLAYRAGLVRVSGTVMKVVVGAMAGLCLYSLAILLCNGLLGMNIPNMFTSTSPLGIAFTGVCVILASITLVMDFQFIEDGEKTGAPKYMEWYGAFGLLSSLVWLYIEILRLLAKLRASDE